MIWRHGWSTLALSTLAVHPLASQASRCDSSGTLWTQLSRCAAAVLPSRDTIGLPDALEQAFHRMRDPNTLNYGLGHIERRAKRRIPIGTLHLQFVNIQHQGDNRLGLTYDWRRDVYRTPHQHGRLHSGHRTGLEARGTLMTVAEENVDDFLEFHLHSTLFVTGGGGVSPVALEAQLRSVGDSLAHVGAGDGSVASERRLQLINPVWDSLNTQFYVAAGPIINFETNQLGTQNQFAAGARVGLDLKAWKPSLRLARFNIFDWPAAAIRYLSGTDSVFRPSGASIPTVQLYYHWVAPGVNRMRAVADTTEGLEPFGRLTLQARYRGKLADVADGTLWLNATLDTKSESDPNDAIAAADLHQFTRVILSVEMPGGMAVSWSSGKQPLTAPKGDRWGLGFRLSFR